MYALGAAALFFGISVIYEAVASDNLDPITARPMDVTGDYFKSYYTMPWNRAQTYIIGIACGYVMHLYRNRDGPKIPIVSSTWWADWSDSGVGMTVDLVVQYCL